MSEYQSFPPEYILELISVAALESGKMTEPFNLAPSDDNKRQIAAVELSSVITDLLQDLKEPAPKWVVDVLKAVAEDSVFLLGICHHLYREWWESEVEAFRNRHAGRVVDRIHDFTVSLMDSGNQEPFYRDRLDYRPHYNAEGDLRWQVVDTESGFVVDDGILTPWLAVERLVEFPERP